MAHVRNDINILGCRLDVLAAAQATARIVALIETRQFAQVVTFGSEMAMLAHRDPAYRAIVNAADLVVPDTIGMVIAARLLGRPTAQRLAGVELIETLCEACAQQSLSVFLLGGGPGVAEDAAQALQQRHQGLLIAGTHDGYFSSSEDNAVANTIRNSGARLLLVALGFPKQETWVREHAAALGPVTCIGVGGSLDIISGRLRRAPRLMRNMGLEWLYRLVREPRRLRRQLALPQFAFLVAVQAFRGRVLSK